MASDKFVDPHQGRTGRPLDPPRACSILHSIFPLEST